MVVIVSSSLKELLAYDLPTELELECCTYPKAERYLNINMMISLRLRTNYVIRVMRIKDKGGRTKFKYYK
jgi:hypothetical protein